MKNYSAEALAAMAAGETVVSGAAWFGGDDPIGLWSGDGPLAFVDERGVTRAFVGIGDRAFASISGGAIGGAEQGQTLKVSGIDPTVRGNLDIQSLRGLPTILWRLVFNGAGTRLLDARVHLRGRIDQAPIEETPDGTSTLSLSIEGAARGQGRRSERMRSDADQRLINPNDSALRRVAYAGQKTIYAGGKPPEQARSAFNGVSPGQSAAVSFVTRGAINL